MFASANVINTAALFVDKIFMQEIICTASLPSNTNGYRGRLQGTSITLRTITIRDFATETTVGPSQKMIFGSKHERFIPSDAAPSQLSLDIQAESTAS